MRIEKNKYLNYFHLYNQLYAVFHNEYCESENTGCVKFD